jgi:hypothetical protein
MVAHRLVQFFRHSIDILRINLEVIPNSVVSAFQFDRFLVLDLIPIIGNFRHFSRSIHLPLCSHNLLINYSQLFKIKDYHRLDHIKFNRYIFVPQPKFLIPIVKHD